ncbi:MAG TPA: type IV pilus twitching motility protein PilT [Gemmatimonadota bacterium]
MAHDEQEGSVTLKEILKFMLQANASDLHLKVGSPPVLRVNGALQPLGKQVISNDHLKTFTSQVLSERQQKILLETRELDCALSIAGLGRFRCNVYYQRGTPSFAIRAIPVGIKGIHELNLPPTVEAVSMRPRGLVLVTGVTGSGKSTTLAAMIQHINLHKRMKIVTVEDPIEFLFRDQLSIISQREIGADTHTFASALKHILRQDPDVIMVGEIRDTETMETAIKAADTGHLVLSTLHTTDAPTTINRIISFFPPYQHDQMRSLIANNLVGIISMRLIPTADGEGRVPACEILVSTEAVREHIADHAKLPMIPTLLQEGHLQYGMQTFDQALMKLYRDGTIRFEDALFHSTNPNEFALRVKGIEATSDTKWTQLTG